MKIIDISHWQGNVDFSQLTDNIDCMPIDGVILKLSQFKHKDVKFEKYYADSHIKYKLGCYIYNKVKNVEEAKIEAEFAVKSLANRPMPLYVWLDLEDRTMRGLGKDLLNEIIETEATILRNAGYNVGIYCNVDWYKNVLDSNNLKNQYKFWIARYPSSDIGVIKESLNPKAYNASIWQYSSKGKVLGIKGNVDMDITLDNIFDDNNIQTKPNNIVNNTNKKEPTKEPTNASAFIKVGQFHSVNFTGHKLMFTGKFDTNTQKQAVRVLQQAMNLDYNENLKLDGVYGKLTEKALGKHFVKLGETQYMVSALVILLLLHGYAVPLDASPEVFDKTIEVVVKQYQKANNLCITGIADASTFKSLVGK